MVTAQDLMRTDYVSVDVKDTIAQMIGKLRKTKQHSALVFDDKKYLGMIARRYLLTSRIDPSVMKVGNVLKKRSKSKITFFVPTLTPNSDLREICKKLATADTHMLPVLEKDKVIGIVSSHDVAKEIMEGYKKLACSELASMGAVTVTYKDEIGKAINIFSRYGIDHLPVVDLQNKIMGMVMLSDLIENGEFWDLEKQKVPRAASHQKGGNPGYQHGEKTSMIALPVEDCMSRKSPCCTAPETKIPAAVELMSENDVCNVILAKDNKAVGILTIKDILIDYIK
ncbi:Inosine-5'-monophosphate dehydrogenase [uncultured archaeon]|nr:Inosine-5'-monophosphate dehydrogenase [uncultured archaeon]